MKKLDGIYDRCFPVLLALIFWGTGMPLWSVLALAVIALPGLINLALDIRQCRK